MADIFLYLALFVSILSLIFMIISLNKKSAQYKIASKVLAQSLKNIMEATSYNVSQFNEFSYLAECHHNALKESLIQPDKENIKRQLDEFTDFLNLGISNIMMKNISFLEHYFSPRSKIDPYISIKFNFEEHKIVTLYYNTKSDHYLDHDIESDTGLFNVFQNGTYYLNNDIETASKQKEYTSVRLSDPKIRYNSTLIIPISIFSNAISEEFKKRFELDTKDDAYRVIYGFICIDHPEKYYFKNDIDPHIGSIFSEYLLLYLIMRQKYIEQSSTYMHAKAIVENKF